MKRACIATWTMLSVVGGVGAAEKPWFVVNEDNDHFFKLPSEEMTVKGLTDYADYIARGKVTHVVLCVCGQRTSYDSKTWEPIWAGLNEEARKDTATRPDGTHDRWAVNCKLLCDKGIDPYAVWIAHFRKKGVSPWLSMRMNDVHFGSNTNYFRNTTFYKTHKEWWLKDGGGDSWADWQFDYAQPEVRAWALAQVREIAERWDSDGLELDWMRFGNAFRYGQERKNAHLLDAFMREARRIVDAAGARRGRRMALSVRVPQTPEEAERLGFNAVKWAREGLVDVVIPDTFMELRYDLPVAKWLDLLKGTKARLIPGTGSSLPGGKVKRKDVPSCYRGLAGLYLQQGAAGVYFFNLPYFSNVRYSTDGRGDDQNDVAAELYTRGIDVRDELPKLAKEFVAKGSYEARPPVLADGVKVGDDDFDGRVSDIYTRLDGETAVGEREHDIALVGWRNERVHAQVVVWTGKARDGLRAEVSALKGPDGATLQPSAVSARFVRYVLGTDHRFECVHPYGSYPDCLDTVERLPLPARSFRPVWLTVEVPAAAKPGAYAGRLTLRVNGGETVVFPIALKVLERTLPAAKDRRFYLDLWQHPLGVARYHGVKPFSAEHYALLEPLYREIASAGQKVITATITDFPWGGGGTPGAYGSEYALNPIRGMVTYVKKSDGTYAADFSLFDEYVAFCRKCGMGPRINCYTIVKFAGRETYQYEDERTGDLVSVDLKTGSEEWKAYMRPLIRLTADHLRSKGWFGDAAIAIDEAPPAKARMARELVREVEPEFQFALAGNVAWEKFGDLDVDDYSQILWHDYEKGDTFMTDNFLDAVRTRGAAGKVTTFYVCSIPGVHKPNNWMHSALVESEWIGLYAAAKGFSGFLRWAVVYWPRDPFFDSSYASHPAGETYFLYPGCRSSMRWEILRDGFEDWEKIRILRETGAATPELEKALAAFDFPTMETADEPAFRAQVECVTKELMKE